MPKSIDIFLTCSSSGPFPTSASTEFGSWERTSLKTANRKSWFFASTNLPTCPIRKVSSAMPSCFLTCIRVSELGENWLISMALFITENDVLRPNSHFPANSLQATLFVGYRFAWVFSTVLRAFLAYSPLPLVEWLWAIRTGTPAFFAARSGKTERELM